MRVLWVCNIMLPAVAEYFGQEGSNKEGWISGLCSVILERQWQNQIDLHVAFPVERRLDGYVGEIVTEKGRFHAYGFYEDVGHAEVYDAGLEKRLGLIMDQVEPDVVHCFGTEYAHTLAAVRSARNRQRVLVGIQGLCSACANAYFASLPEEVIHSLTFRDVVKRDSLVQQQRKFAKRGETEREIIRLAANVTGRTEQDRYYTGKWNPGAHYFAMNETLRSSFYEGRWEEEKCVPHSIFLSQGDYPLKGLHYMLLALPAIRRKYPDATVSVAGNSLVEYGTLKDKLKLSAYGRYLRRLIRENELENCVRFLGRLNEADMRKQYLKSHLYVCCSSNENSPNSLGEAMLLGIPCVSADVGGVSSMFQNQEDGICYEGFRTEKNAFDSARYPENAGEKTLEEISGNLAEAVTEMWENPDRRKLFCKNAENHARATHDREKNYQRMVEIYAEIAQEK